MPKMRGILTASMPMPLSAMLTHRLLFFAPRAQRDAAARRRELDGVRQDVGEDLHHARVIGVERQVALGQVQFYRDLLGGGGLRAQFVRVADDGLEADALALQRDLAAGDARHVEQVVHQPRQVRDLAFDHAADAFDLRHARI